MLSDKSIWREEKSREYRWCQDYIMRQYIVAWNLVLKMFNATRANVKELNYLFTVEMHFVGFRVRTMKSR